MRSGKPGRIGNEALRLGSAVIEAEVVKLLHSGTPNAGSKMLLCMAPSLESSNIQVWVRTGLVAEESIQRLESASRNIETPAQGLLQTHVPCKDRRERGGKPSSRRRHRWSSFALHPLPGTGRGTSRKSSVASRKYVDVLSAERCPRMSPMVLREVPLLRRWTATEWRRQCGPWKGIVRPLFRTKD